MSKENKPIIISVDDDPQVLRSLKRDLRKQYKDQYRIISTDSADEATAAVEELKKKGEVIALFLSDQRMPEMNGVDFLEKARKFYPDAKRVLLTAYSDTQAAIKAINDVQLDYYLMKPWDPPEQKLYPVINELLEDWQLSYRPEWKGLKLVGYPYSPKSHNLKDWLAGNLMPYRWMEAGTDDAEELMQLHGIEPRQLPAVVTEKGELLVDPQPADLAEALGMSAHAQEELYDVVIIGAGPAGMAAAQQLARVAYHLGNRHVAVQVGENWLRYLRDHVLDDMVTGLGCEIIYEELAFEPESGAYHSHRH